ncbi:MAG: hypothetical protein ACI304_09730 [Lepagella sp.]
MTYFFDISIVLAFLGEFSLRYNVLYQVGNAGFISDFLNNRANCKAYDRTATLYCCSIIVSDACVTYCLNSV